MDTLAVVLTKIHLVPIHEIQFQEWSLLQFQLILLFQLMRYDCVRKK